MIACGDRVRFDRETAGEECQRIHEMADLADNAPAAFILLDPAVRWNRAGINPVEHYERPAARIKRGLRLDHKGGETSVETDGEDTRCVFGRGDHVRKAFRVEGKRLLAEDVLTRAQRIGGKARVRVVAGGNEDCVNIGICEHGGRIRGDGRESVLLTRMARADAG